jgi:hypothetical protein
MFNPEFLIKKTDEQNGESVVKLVLDGCLISGENVGGTNFLRR